MNDLPLLIGIIAGLIGSAAFSGIETVFLTLDRLRLYSRRSAKDKRFAKILYFTNNPERFVVSSLIGTNLVNVIYGSLIALYMKNYGYGEEAILLVSPLILLVFSESLPKALARQFAEMLSHIAAVTLYYFRMIIWPVARAVEISIASLERTFGVGGETVSHALTRSDITYVIGDAGGKGEVASHETRWIRRLMSLNERTVADVATPRNRTITIKIDAPVEEAFDIFSKTGHKRLVCIGKNEDDLLGVIRASDLVKRPKDLQSILRPVPIIPESLSVIRLVDWMKKHRTHFAISIDEYGGFAGVVTLNDLATELVGPIRDKQTGDLKECIRLNDRTWLASGSIRLNHLWEITGFEATGRHANSLGGLIVELADGIPANGEEFRLPGAVLRVLRADNQGVRLVRLALEVPSKSGR